MDKFCKDCWFMDKHNSNGLTLPATYWKCTKVKAETSLVDGQPVFVYCEQARDYLGSECGPDGKLFMDRKERDLEIKREGGTFESLVRENNDE